MDAGILCTFADIWSAPKERSPSLDHAPSSHCFVGKHSNQNPELDGQPLIMLQPFAPGQAEAGSGLRPAFKNNAPFEMFDLAFRLVSASVCGGRLPATHSLAFSRPCSPLHEH